MSISIISNFGIKISNEQLNYQFPLKSRKLSQSNWWSQRTITMTKKSSSRTGSHFKQGTHGMSISNLAISMSINNNKQLWYQNK